MTAIYDAYKPLRNYLRQCTLETTLADTWQLSQHVANPAAMPAPVEAGKRPYSLDGQLFPWDLPAITREVLLHAQPRGGQKRLNSLAAVQTVVNSLRATGNEGSKLRLTGQDDVFNELLRMSHHQFPWQQGNIYGSLIRHLKIFGASSVAPILEKQTGLTAKEFFFLGFMLVLHLKRSFDINSAQDYSEFGIAQAKAIAFFSRLSMSIDDLRPLLAAQPVDATWDYGWNPLEATPLVALDPEHPNRLFCPVPDLLLRRFSTGLYYDLVKVSGFDNAFGSAFEAYVGEVLAVAYQDGPATVLKEAPYSVGLQAHHGPDWIVCDAGGNLVVECKTKRLTHAARQAGEDALRAEVDKIAGAVVQNYKNIGEAQQGLSSWKPNAHPIIPLVITFEDWFFLGPLLHELLEQSVRSQLLGAGLNDQLMEAMPYAVMSCREFELCIGAVREGGIAKFFQGKRKGEYLQWMWPEYLYHEYKGMNPINFQKAFQADWRKVIPEAAIPKNSAGDVSGA
ncbi:hypothetical protein LPB72_14940 [Hydrogenophaga crassostreae]|uniref:Restriction endonuclease n=1 Tax=Hydrogenophaga crassostreae TaxID=1763535 RepID=A0A167HHA8_9BURK|nr:hypothetical protein [Hydrogenophaga crassostreae]AOW12253.1 hypothetical protein LPB072_04690 [Hydrogenophaga crassostreae]OAD41200.1 hypothetical protein LPB72_14940 [Hydrogenophaga crassostreae]